MRPHLESQLTVVAKLLHFPVEALRAALAGGALIILLTITLAHAAAEPDARTACRADFRQYCANTQPGGGRIRKCLTDNFDQLSDACKKAVSASR